MSNVLFSYCNKLASNQIVFKQKGISVFFWIILSHEVSRHFPTYTPTQQPMRTSRIFCIFTVPWRIYPFKLRWQYYNYDATWVKHLHLQLPQEPCSNRNLDNMTEYMLRERRLNKYMQQCIFSVAGIRAGTEGKFSAPFKNIMERARSSEKFQSSRGRHEREFEFDYIFRCFFNTNGRVFPNDDNCMLGVMCGLAALHEAVALGHC